MKKILYSFLTLILGLVLSSSGCTHDTIDPALFDEGVEINGVIWATRNVGEFGKFAANETDPGMFYQWNRKTAYSATDPLTPAWNTAAISAPFDPANDPCPDGWRRPTWQEAITLRDATKVDYAWEGNGGRFKDKTTPDNAIFLPAAGYRSEVDGSLLNKGVYGNYWENWSDDSTIGGIIIFWNGGTGSTNGLYLQAYPIRCVKGAK